MCDNYDNQHKSETKKMDLVLVFEKKVLSLHIKIEYSRIMNISFKKTKTNKVYQDFVENPSDRKKRRIFSKEFNESIADEAVKVHKRLKAYPTAGDYNKEYGQTLNAIELKKGEKQNDPLVLKTRVTGNYRIFFNQILDKADRVT